MEIPFYPASRPLALGDKPLLDAIFLALGPRVSEFCFAGLYLFRHAHGYRLTRMGETLIIAGKGYDGGSYVLPPLGGDISGALALLFADGWELYAADEEFAGRYLNNKELRMIEDRDSFDYLYLREELATLPGNRYHKKKSHINYFARRNVYHCEPFEPRHRDDCRALLRKLQVMESTEHMPSLRLELDAAVEAVELAGSLELSGVVVIVDGRVEAFSLGERLNRDTAVCHFEKANPFFEGIAQVVNREFAARLFTDCRFVNREQDLGEPGLRTAKLSYHPLELVRKYRVQHGGYQA